MFPADGLFRQIPVCGVGELPEHPAHLRPQNNQGDDVGDDQKAQGAWKALEM